MSEQTTVEATPSVATETPVEIPRSGTDGYAQWRMTGELPKSQPKIEASATSDASKETKSENAPEPDAGKSTQESRRKPGAEARIGELTSRLKQLERDLEEARRPKQTQAESSPAKPAPIQATRIKPTMGDKNQDGTPKYSQYEDFIEDLADWKAEQRFAHQAAEQAGKQAVQRVAEAKAKATELYPDFEKVAGPMADKVMGLLKNPQVDAVLKNAMIDPDGFHILYALGGDQNLVRKFENLALSDPAEAIFLWKSLKADVKAELSKPAERDDKGQFKATPPAKRGPESAPEPPIEIGNRGSAPTNESERAFSALERGDNNATRAWLKAENAKDMRRRRGI